MMDTYRRLMSLTLILFSASMQAGFLPENHAVNGGLTVIPIDIKQKPEVYYKQQRVLVTKSIEPNQWLLVVGIPLANTQSIQQLTMTKPYSSTIPFHVSDKDYVTQYLTISDQRKVDPFKEDEARINREKEKLATLFAKYSSNNPFSQSFKAPVHAPISSQFGLKRVYNKAPRAPHSGLDIAAAENTPVLAAAKGTVVETGDYFFTGNTVIVDHGMGVFSLYAHLKTIDAKIGEPIKQGARLGTVGMTGRVTGPHLHWTMIMNQTLVDPLLFVSVKNITAVPKPVKLAS